MTAKDAARLQLTLSPRHYRRGTMQEWALFKIVSLVIIVAEASILRMSGQGDTVFRQGHAQSNS